MVEVISLETIGENERGITHSFQNDRTGQFLLAHRKKDSVNGGHYHTGKHSYKNPERLILLNGEGILNWKTSDGTQSGSEKVIAPAEIIIPANIWHEMIAVTDFVMLELNGLDAGKDDTFQL